MLKQKLVRDIYDERVDENVSIDNSNPCECMMSSLPRFIWKMECWEYCSTFITFEENFYLSTK